MLQQQILESKKDFLIKNSGDVDLMAVSGDYDDQPVRPQPQNGMFHCHSFHFHCRDKCMLCKSCQLHQHNVIEY